MTFSDKDYHYECAGKEFYYLKDKWSKFINEFNILYKWSINKLIKMNYDYDLFESYIKKKLENPHKITTDFINAILYFLNYKIYYGYSDYTDDIIRITPWKINIFYYITKTLIDLGYYLRITKPIYATMSGRIEMHKDTSKICDLYLLINKYEGLQNNFIYAVIIAQSR